MTPVPVGDTWDDSGPLRAPARSAEPSSPSPRRGEGRGEGDGDQSFPNARSGPLWSAGALLPLWERRLAAALLGRVAPRRSRSLPDSYRSAVVDGVISESGNNVSLTVTIGGITTQYTNTPGSASQAFLLAGQNQSNAPIDPSGDVITIGGNQTNLEPGQANGFGLSLSNPTDVIFSGLGPNGVANLQNFDFSKFNYGIASYEGTSNYAAPLTFLVEGTITSVVAVPAPEPSTLAVFGAMAIGVMAWRRMSRL
jgi:hypothetical protein